MPQNQMPQNQLPQNQLPINQLPPNRIPQNQIPQSIPQQQPIQQPISQPIVQPQPQVQSQVNQSSLNYNNKPQTIPMNNYDSSIDQIFRNYEPKIKIAENLRDEALNAIDKYVTDPEVKGVEELGNYS